jgi:hypothetical protein
MLLRDFFQFCFPRERVMEPRKSSIDRTANISQSVIKTTSVKKNTKVGTL